MKNIKRPKNYVILSPTFLALNGMFKIAYICIGIGSLSLSIYTDKSKKQIRSLKIRVRICFIKIKLIA